MYQIKQSRPFCDQLVIETSDGETKTFDVLLDITPQLAKEYRTLQMKLIDLQKKQKETKENGAFVEAIGECIVDTMKLLLGEPNTRELLNIYDGNYTSMLYDVFPFINEVIVPQIQKLAQTRKQQLKRRFR